VVVLEVAQTLQKFKFKGCRLGTIVDDKGGIFPTFSHVKRPKVERTLLTTALFKHDRDVLLHTSSRDFDSLFGTFLPVDFDRDLARNHV